MAFIDSKHFVLPRGYTKPQRKDVGAHIPCGEELAL
jgi:hypothetical protein